MHTDWDHTFSLISEALARMDAPLPSVSMMGAVKKDPFHILISTIISLRTKDEVTIAASKRLFQIADNPRTMSILPLETIEQAIFPAGFYRVKAKNIHTISSILIDQYQGAVPSDKAALLALPGVGVKTANLTLNLGFGIDAICVDTHVHRISNRLGWIGTNTPEASEKALENIMPQRFWIPLNELLVTFGQHICKPISPLCSCCPLAKECPRIGVKHSR